MALKFTDNQRQDIITWQSDIKIDRNAERRAHSGQFTAVGIIIALSIYVAFYLPTTMSTATPPASDSLSSTINVGLRASGLMVNLFNLVPWIQFRQMRRRSKWRGRFTRDCQTALDRGHSTAETRNESYQQLRKDYDALREFDLD